jgi:4-amino-4-deoxy-L-arabinose transferase-like glycosyltransferase
MRLAVDPLGMTTLLPPAFDSHRVSPSELAPIPATAEVHRSRPAGAWWPRLALAGLLVGTGVLYLWALGRSGWANTFYSAAVQAGTKSWKAMFFGSSDSANFITIDKPPAALWVMDVSARLFGVNSWSILVPEALEGVAAIGILYATVRRWFGPGAGLLAGAVLAVTPVAALMFRFNNPDALLVLLLTGAAYAMVRALEAGRTRWLVLASTLIGFGFLAKMLQALLVVPAFALVYLIAAPNPIRRRIGQLVVAGGALVAASLWWVVAVELIPAGSRPYIGGSQDNSIWNLMFGYNGFGRLTGNETGSVGGGGATGSRWGLTGLYRMFNSEFGGQASWLIPAALILLVAGLLVTWRAPRLDRTRAALLLWGGWLAVTAVVFSFGRGIIHPYYTVALAPAVGAVVGVGSAALWTRRSSRTARAGLASALAAAAIWAYVLLRRTPTWHPWLAAVVLMGGLALAGLLLVWAHLPSRVSLAVVLAAVAIGLAGPVSYTLATVATPHGGAIPSAGPAGAGGPGGGAGGGPRGGFAAGARGVGPGGTAGGGAGLAAGGGAGGVRGGGPGGGAGGLLNGSSPTTALTSLLKERSADYTWVAAAVGSNTAAGYQLAASAPVMAIGGFNGTDPSPTLAEFQHDVAEGKIHYFISGGGGFGGANGPSAAVGATAGSASGISTWVTSHFTPQTVGGVTIYDLTQAPAGS